MDYTPEERELLEHWPTITEQDIQAINAQFKNYLFYRKKREGSRKTRYELHCSACGKSETKHSVHLYVPGIDVLELGEEEAFLRFIDGLEHKQNTVCPFCGRRSMAINLSKAGQRKGLKEHHSMMLLHTRGRELYADYLLVWKNYENSLTAMPEYNPLAGYHFRQGQVTQIRHGWKQYYFSYERNRLGKKKQVNEGGRYLIIHPNAVLENPFYRYCGYFQHWNQSFSRYYEGFISYLTVYSIYPRQLEMLVKTGMKELVTDMVNFRMKHAMAFKWEETNPQKAFDLTKQDLAWVLEHKPPMAVLKIRKYVKKHFGLLWSFPFCLDFFYLWGQDFDVVMSVFRFLSKYHLPIKKFLSYADKIVADSEENFHEENFLSYCTVFELYQDYIDAIYQLGYCMEHSKLLWPDDLCVAHDKAAAELEEKQGTGIGQALDWKTRKQKYEFQWGDYSILFPTKAAAIKREGKLLSHCVGGYAERHMKGISTILFLRRTEKIRAPYVTIEMDGNKIKQIHGYQNDVSTGINQREANREFLELWLEWLRKGSQRDEQGNPVLPKKKIEVKVS